MPAPYALVLRSQPAAALGRCLPALAASRQRARTPQVRQPVRCAFGLLGAADDKLGFMAFESDKVMFEIYKEKIYTGKYRAVFYTELQDHERDWEISRAMAGESFYDGFLKNYRLEQGKQIVLDFVNRLNSGDAVTPAELDEALREYAAT